MKHLIFTGRVKLSTLLASGEPLSPQEAFIVTNQLVSSLRCLHKLGLVAGRIDPDHIMVEQDDTVSDSGSYYYH